MKTLKDVYIKVTEKNTEYLSKLIGFKLPINHYLCFLYDLNAGLHYYGDEPKDKQKVSLSELKRLIETIPTREEMTRLKKRANTYKQCFDGAKKENKELHKMYDDLVLESGKKQNLLQNLYDDALKLNEDILEGSEYFRKQYRLAQSELELLKNKKWYQIWR